MPHILGNKLESVSSIEFTCPKPDTLAISIARSCRCEMVVHHDHILDFIHGALLNKLSPPDTGHLYGRPDHGQAFSNFVNLNRHNILERIREAKTPNGMRIIRFEPTRVCQSLNAKDGNGKPKAKYTCPTESEIIKYWSMTPDELQRCARTKKAWDTIYDADLGKIERYDAADALVKTLLAEHYRQGR